MGISIGQDDKNDPCSHEAYRLRGEMDSPSSRTGKNLLDNNYIHISFISGTFHQYYFTVINLYPIQS